MRSTVKKHKTEQDFSSARTMNISALNVHPISPPSNGDYQIGAQSLPGSKCGHLLSEPVLYQMTPLTCVHPYAAKK